MGRERRQKQQNKEIPQDWVGGSWTNSPQRSCGPLTYSLAEAWENSSISRKEWLSGAPWRLGTPGGLEPKHDIPSLHQDPSTEQSL